MINNLRGVDNLEDLCAVVDKHISKVVATKEGQSLLISKINQILDENDLGLDEKFVIKRSIPALRAKVLVVDTELVKLVEKARKVDDIAQENFERLLVNAIICSDDHKLITDLHRVCFNDKSIKDSLNPTVWEKPIKEEIDEIVLNMPPLHLAARKNDIKQAERLYKYGFPSNVKAANGQTSLHIASFFGHTDMAELLIINKEKVEEQDKTGKTPLHLASITGELETAELLIKNKAKVEAQDETGKTPLFCAAVTDEPEMIGLLISKGASINYVDSYGFTPLSFASKNKFQDIVSRLTLVRNQRFLSTGMKYACILTNGVCEIAQASMPITQLINIPLRLCGIDVALRDPRNKKKAFFHAAAMAALLFPFGRFAAIAIDAISDATFPTEKIHNQKYVISKDNALTILNLEKGDENLDYKIKERHKELIEKYKQMMKEDDSMSLMRYLSTLVDDANRAFKILCPESYVKASLNDD